MHGLRTASPHQSIETQYFSFANGERNIGKLGGIGKAFNLQNQFPGIGFPLRINLVNRATDHQAHQIVLGHVFDGTIANFFTVAQADPAIRHTEYFIKLVGDEKHGAAFGFKSINNAKQLIDFAGRK